MRQIHFRPNVFVLIHHRTLPHYNLSFDCIMCAVVIIAIVVIVNGGGGGGDSFVTSI